MAGNHAYVLTQDARDALGAVLYCAAQRDDPYSDEVTVTVRIDDTLATVVLPRFLLTRIDEQEVKT